MKKCILEWNFLELLPLETERKGVLTVIEIAALSTCSQSRKRKTMTVMNGQFSAFNVNQKIWWNIKIIIRC